MILEIAQIEIKAGMEKDFEAGVKTAAPIFKRAKGCHGMELQRARKGDHRLASRWRRVPH